jgi:ribosomal protein S27AE
MADPPVRPLNAEANLAKVYGEAKRCPICGAFAETVPHPEFRWVCGVCGTPRVEVPGGKPPEESLVALREASQAQRAAAMQRLTTWATGVPAALTLLLALVLAPASLIAGGTLIGMGVLLAILSARASRRAGTERKRLRGAVERAWEAAIMQVAAADKSVTDVATALRISEADVEAALALEGRVRIGDSLPTETEVAAKAEEEHASEADALGDPGPKPGAGKEL